MHKVCKCSERFLLVSISKWTVFIERFSSLSATQSSFTTQTSIQPFSHQGLVTSLQTTNLLIRNAERCNLEQYVIYTKFPDM